MNVNLEIAEDAKLRKAVKDMVAGQVANILRNDLATIVDANMARVSDEVIQTAVNKVVKEEVKLYLNKHLKQMVDDTIQKAVNGLLPSYMQKEFPAAVDRGVNTVINRLVKFKKT